MWRRIKWRSAKARNISPVTTSKYVAKAFLWGFLSRAVLSLSQFVAVPILLSKFGKVDYGLIVLATSINAYIQLLDLGVSTGAVKYFSQWIQEKDYHRLNSVARTSLTFYGIIGLINVLVLVLISYSGMSSFSLEPNQVPVMRNLLLIIALFAVMNWCSSVFNQLLIANELIHYVEKVNILKSLLGFAVVVGTVLFNWSLITYYFLFVLVNSLVIAPYYLEARKHKLIISIKPGGDWQNFGRVFRYSLAIIVMGLFQMSATKLRPVFLALFSNDGTQIVTDFRIMETITLFIVYVGAMFTGIFLPKTSKLLVQDKKDQIEFFTYTATKYTTILVVVLSLPVILSSSELLTLFVGKEYTDLSYWLDLWLVFIIFGLHNSPVASLVISSGKTKMLVFSSALACIVSLAINASLAPKLGVGAAVIGYNVYILIQMSFYYLYFNRYVLGLESLKVFKSFAGPALVGFLTAAIVFYMSIDVDNMIFQIIYKSLLWLVFYVGSLVLFKVLCYREIKTILNKIL